MSLIESELGQAIYSPVKKITNKTRKLRAVARKVTAPKTSAPSEVMVKVTGFSSGASHVKAHLDYITRNGKLEMENESGQVFTGRDEVNELFQDWSKDFGKAQRYVNAAQSKNQRDTMHVMLSMPEMTDPEAVKIAVREFSKTTFGQNHEYVFALHTDVKHPHCHVTVKCQGFDGKRLNPRKADLQQWRETFAEKLCQQGVDAVATPRVSRGVVKKAERNVVRHIERGDATHKPRVPKVKAAKVKEVAQELAAEAKGAPVEPKPWEKAIEKRRETVRRAWLTAATALELAKPITFNQKEARNERPNYDQISAEQARPNQRIAALHQSHLEKSGQRSSPESIASLRNLSSVGVVHDKRLPEMFLRPDALNRLGLKRTADSEMRRARAGDSGAPGREGGLADDKGIGDANKQLAARIRGFVAAMPPLMTERQQLKQDLAAKFTTPTPEKIQTEIHGNIPKSAPAAAPKSEPKKGAEQAAPKQGEQPTKDFER